MEFENEHWRLVITPRYVRKNASKVKVACISCDGRGFSDNPDDIGLGSRGISCTWCDGTGKREVLPEIPPPPEMDKKFVEDLKEWFKNYHIGDADE